MMMIMMMNARLPPPITEPPCTHTKYYDARFQPFLPAQSALLFEICSPLRDDEQHHCKAKDEAKRAGPVIFTPLSGQTITFVFR